MPRFLRLLLTACLLGQAVLLRADFSVPDFSSPVVDQAALFSGDFQQNLESNLNALYNAGGSQYAVLTVEDLGGLPIEQASIKVTDQWKLGKKGADNGVLILVAKSERRIRIEVGYGLEGVLTDAFTSRVIREVMVPFLREGKPEDAVAAGINALMQVSDPQIYASLAKELPAAHEEPSAGGIPLNFFVFGVFIFLFIVLHLLRFLGGGRRGGWGGGYWGPGGFGGGGFGGGGFGGGGGGFGGGGGGGFGGGGASGGW